ncbi:MAG: endonuclease/exonuclease/phosphatase family protein [Deltaproteobacteria bacterium]|nr:endonuclease/exonuclease/phosphatase family protein [Deltaproteobacteria bacterium]
MAVLVGGCREPPRPEPDALAPAPDALEERVEVRVPEDAPGAPTVRVATYNVHRYFDAVCDSGRCAAGDFEEAPTEEAFTQQTDRIARAVLRLDSDVVLLQEVETRGCLDALQARLGALGAAYETAVHGEIGTPGSVDVAVLARWPRVATRLHRRTRLPLPDGGTTTFAREFLEVELRVRGRTVVVFAAHFRSMVGDDPARRLAEAVAARELVTASARRAPDALVVLGGDLNDTPGSPTLDALEAGGGVVRVTRGLAPAAVATYQYFGVGQALDHLHFAADAAGRDVPGTAAVVRDRLDGRAGLGDSDHAALRAEFTLGP